MSDSDSDDTFTALISNGEENFWKNYEVVADSPLEDSISTAFPTNLNFDAPSTSSTVSKGKSSISKTKMRLGSSPKPSTSKGAKTTRSKRKEKSSASSLDDCSDETVSKPSPSKKKRKAASDEQPNETVRSNSILNTILQTLSAPTPTQPQIPAAAQQPPELALAAPLPQTSQENANESDEINIISTTFLSYPRNRRRRRTRTTPRVNPRRSTRNTINYFNPNIIEHALAQPLQDGSKTPPYKNTKVEDINPEIEVRILWKSMYTKLFKIKRFTPMKKIVEYFANKENIASKHIYFTINDRFVNLNVNSCCTLRYHPPDEIEGSVVQFDVYSKRLPKNESGIKLKVQLNRIVEHVMLDNDIMLVHLYAQVVIKFNLILERFKLQFDGRNIDYLHTIRDLGMEEGDCIDVMLI